MQAGIFACAGDVGQDARSAAPADEAAALELRWSSSRYELDR